MHFKRLNCALVVMAISAVSLEGCISFGQVKQTGPDSYSVITKADDIFEGVPARVEGRYVARREAFAVGEGKCKALEKTFTLVDQTVMRAGGSGTFDNPFSYICILKFRCE